MCLQTPPAEAAPAPSAGLAPAALGFDPQIEAGVVEDARARQRHERRIVGLLAAAAVAVGGLIVAFGGGGGKSSGGGSGGSSSGSGGGSAAHLGVNNAVLAVPSTQPDSYGVQTDVCPLAPASRYLPARSGCVTVKRVYLDGGRKPALVIVYSRIGSQHPTPFAGMPTKLRREFVAQGAFLKVVLPDGASVSTRISETTSTKASAIDGVARVGSGSTVAIFVQIQRIEDDTIDVVYSLRAGRLVTAGVMLDYGYGYGPMYKDGFDCLPGNPSRVIQRSFVASGPDASGSHSSGLWRETEITYAWRGPALVRIGTRSFKLDGQVPAAETGVGRGCDS